MISTRSTALLVALSVTASHAIAQAQAQGGSPRPRDVAITDLDGDGDLDIVIADNDGDQLMYRLNDGAGNFAAAVTVAAGAGNTGVVAIAVGDLDGDGNPDDVALACDGSNTVAAITNPTGGSSVATYSSAGQRVSDVAVGDLDGVQPDDIVFVRQGQPLLSGGGLEVSLNGGAPVDVAFTGTAAQLVKVCLADLDGDGDLDAAAVAQGPTDSILLFDNSGGTLSFAGSIGLASSGLANGLSCCDLDGDGDADLAVVMPVLFPTAGQDLRLLMRTGTAPLDPTDFTAAPDIATPGTFAVDLACGDLDDNGFAPIGSRQDIVVVNAGSGDVSLQDGYDAGSQTFGAVGTITAGTLPIAAAIGDLNADGGDDVVIANYGSGDLTISLTTQPAFVQSFGTGCAGTGGQVPVLSATGLPTSGNASYGTQIANAVPFSAWLTAIASTDTVNPLNGSCTLYLDDPISFFLQFTNAAGQDTFTLAIPASATFFGFDLFFQGAVFDANGLFPPGIALSNALRVQIGS